MSGGANRDKGRAAPCPGQRLSDGGTTVALKKLIVPPTINLASRVLTATFAVCVFGCEPYADIEIVGEVYTPPVSTPSDSGAPPPSASDSGSPPPVPKDAGSAPPMSKDAGAPPLASDAGTPQRNSYRGAGVYPDFLGVAYNGNTFVEQGNPNVASSLSASNPFPELRRFEAMLGGRKLPYVQQFAPLATRAGATGAGDTNFVSNANRDAVRSAMVDGLNTFVNDSSAAWNARHLHGQGRTIVITVPIALRVWNASGVESPYATLAQAAAGELNSVFASVAQRYKSVTDSKGAPLSRIIWRIGWEANTKTHPWSPKFPNGGTPVPTRIVDFKAAFAQAVSTMKANGHASWKYQLDGDIFFFSAGFGTAWWPGDAHVDIVGVTYYDEAAWNAANGGYPGGIHKTDADREAYWQLMLSRLNAMKTWVEGHTSKPLKMSIPEYGASWGGDPSVQTAPGKNNGGDNAVFVRNLMNWIDALAPADFAYHAYFNKWGDWPPGYQYGSTKLTPRYAVQASGASPALSDMPKAATAWAQACGD